MSEKKSILVVDDDYDCRNLVRTVLSSHGYEVIDVESGKEALDVMSEGLPALLLLDIMMPEMTGYDVVTHMKQRPEMQNVPIIMLTAKGENEDILKGYSDFQVDYYIPKPFTTRQLLAGIEMILG